MRHFSSPSHTLRAQTIAMGAGTLTLSFTLAMTAAAAPRTASALKASAARHGQATPKSTLKPVKTTKTTKTTKITTRPRHGVQRRREKGVRVAVKLPTKAIRGRIAKPQVMLYLGRRAPVFRPWIRANAATYDRRNEPRRSLYR